MKDLKKKLLLNHTVVSTSSREPLGGTTQVVSHEFKTLRGYHPSGLHKLVEENKLTRHEIQLRWVPVSEPDVVCETGNMWLRLI